MSEMESIESRRLLSASTLGEIASPEVKLSKTGTLHVKGTQLADRIEVRATKQGIAVAFGDDVVKTFSKGVKRIAVQGGAGKDRVFVDVKSSIAAKLVGGKGKDTLSRPVVDARLSPAQLKVIDDATDKVALIKFGDRANLNVDAGGYHTVMFPNTQSFPIDPATVEAGVVTIEQVRTILGDSLTDWFVTSDAKDHALVIMHGEGAATKFAYDVSDDLVTVTQLTDFDPMEGATTSFRS